MNNLSNSKVSSTSKKNIPLKYPNRENKVNLRYNQKKINIVYRTTNDSFEIKIDSHKYSVKYPKNIFSYLDQQTKDVLLANFIYTRTAPLTLNNNLLFFHMPRPLLKEFVDYGVKKDLPRIKELIRANQAYQNSNYNFSTSSKTFFVKDKHTNKVKPNKKTSKDKAILSLSFGKDSLLSYGLAEEIGLNISLAFVNDMEKYNGNEFKIKKEIMRKFLTKEKKEIFFIQDNTDNIFRHQEITGQEIMELDMTNAMLSFALELVPLAYQKQARYIIFGNEKDMSDYFLNNEGKKVYHACDQSSEYMAKKNHYLARLSDKNLRVISLIEPLYNLAEMKIIAQRYPRLLPYTMSCNSDKLTSEKWCGQCEVCAEMYLYATASFGEPEKIGLYKNYFDKKYQNLFPIFSGRMSNIEFYEKYREAPQVRDEHLLAFLLAYRRGFKGDLIDLFKNKYLKESLRREKELYKRFFGIHHSASLPDNLKEKVVKIFKQELINYS